MYVVGREGRRRWGRGVREKWILGGGIVGGVWFWYFGRGGMGRGAEVFDRYVELFTEFHVT